MKKILIIQPWIQLGGAELVSIHLAHTLRQRGHKVAIACTYLDTCGLPESALSLDYRLPPRPLADLCKRSRLFFLLCGYWLLLLTVIRSSRDVDFLNPHNFPSSWIAVLVGRIRGIPVIWTCNEPPQRLDWREASKIGLGDTIGWLLASSPLDRFLASKVEAVYVPSEMTRRQVRQLYGRDAEVVRLGVDGELYSQNGQPVVPGGMDLAGKFVLLAVGKLHPQKNQIAAIRAVEQVLPTIPNLILLLAGDGPMRGEWGQYVEDHGLGSHVVFLGSVPHSDMPSLYSCCDINLFTPINQSWGLTPFEALLMGKISIVSNDSGASEVIASQGIGVVCMPSAADVGKWIAEMLNQPDRYRAMANRGRDYVMRELTWGRYADGFLRILARLDQGAARPEILSAHHGAAQR
jgi:glycosyltransferase involved in cell wall biosynthesis